MSDETEQGKSRLAPDGDSQEDRTVAKLMNLAGARSAIPADIQARVHDRVIHEWRDATVREPASGWILPIGLAATVLIAFALLLNVNKPAPLPMGMVTRLAASTGNQQSGLAIDDIVRVGDTIRSGNNQAIGISLNDGGSLRLAQGTILHLDSVHSYTLDIGEVYADSGRPGLENDGMTIRTALGTATDRGTQFAVHVADDALSIAVREGIVDVTGDDKSFSASAGNRLIISTDGGVTMDEIEAHDPSWDWATELAPDFEMKDKSLLDFLLWATRETGHELIFESDDTRAVAATTMLHGSVSGFTPQAAIDAVLATTSFDYDIDDNRLIVGQ